ncbi:unnamed protein product [Mytilus coruscus]|uniref:Integrase catalytic domain-containing protein n=1 Tax=Mytilus coruscus TaxID=42192 RepID=A0A6J8DD00_MYTCO|nr:unnamed protein product [Mytilus coruscus]
MKQPNDYHRLTQRDFSYSNGVTETVLESRIQYSKGLNQEEIDFSDLAANIVNETTREANVAPFRPGEDCRISVENRNGCVDTTTPIANTYMNRVIDSADQGYDSIADFTRGGHVTNWWLRWDIPFFIGGEKLEVQNCEMATGGIPRRLNFMETEEPSSKITTPNAQGPQLPVSTMDLTMDNMVDVTPSGEVQMRVTRGICRQDESSNGDQSIENAGCITQKEKDSNDAKITDEEQVLHDLEKHKEAERDILEKLRDFKRQKKGFPMEGGIAQMRNTLGCDSLTLKGEGATLCIIHPRKFYALPPEAKSLSKINKRKLCMANGDSIPTLGTIDLPVKIGGSTVIQKFTVTEIDAPAVLGHCNKQDQKEFTNTELEGCIRMTKTNDDIEDQDTEDETHWIEQKTTEEIIQAQKSDEILGKLYQMKTESKDKSKWGDIAIQNPIIKRYWSQWDRIVFENGVLNRQWLDSITYETVNQLLVPSCWTKDILQLLHNNPTSGHLGIHKTVARVRRIFYLVDFKADILKWIQQCTMCTSRKQPPRRAKSKMKQYHVGAPMERVALDIIGPFPLSKKGNKYSLIVSDYFTRWAEGYPMPDMETKTIIDNFANNFVCIFGVPRQIHTNQGRQFESALFKELCTRLCIDKTRTTPYRPQSDGLVERLNRSLEEILSKYVCSNQRD